MDTSADERRKQRADEAKSMLAELKAKLTNRVDPAKLGAKSKLPFKVMSHRESLLYRMTELAESGLGLYDANKVASAFTLTRSAFETAAMIYRLYLNMDLVVERREVIDMDKFLMRSIFGEKSADARLEGFNILTAIDKKFKGTRKSYDSLSDYAHPNFSGTLSLYGKFDKEKIWLDLGWPEKARQLEGLPLLCGALGIFKFYYQAIVKLMPKFIAICDEAVDKRSR